MIPWQVFAQGEYVGPHRRAHVPEYRIRVDDLLEIIYRVTRIQSPHEYRLEVGDELRVESLIDEQLDRQSLTILPDGTITLRLIGQVAAARRTVSDLREELERRYQKFYKVPSITVTPIKVATKLEDLRATVDNRFGNGGQQVQVRVTPEGTISLPAIGVVYVQGLTLNEMAGEINARYAEVEGIGNGIEVTPTLLARAPRFVYVFGEVQNPNRFEMEGPTTAMMALSLAGGYLNGANMREVVVLRRGEDWRLLATKLDLHGVALGRRPAPSDEIWLRDSDIVIVPKSALRVTTDLIELLFTEGLYRVAPQLAIRSAL